MQAYNALQHTGQSKEQANLYTLLFNVPDEAKKHHLTNELSQQIELDAVQSRHIHRRRVEWRQRRGYRFHAAISRLQIQFGRSFHHV